MYFKKIDLRTLLQSQVDYLKKEYPCNFHLDIEKDIPHAYGDPLQLEKTLQTAMGNMISSLSSTEFKYTLRLIPIEEFHYVQLHREVQGKTGLFFLISFSLLDTENTYTPELEELRELQKTMERHRGFFQIIPRRGFSWGLPVLSCKDERKLAISDALAKSSQASLITLC